MRLDGKGFWLYLFRLERKGLVTRDGWGGRAGWRKYNIFNSLFMFCHFSSSGFCLLLYLSACVPRVPLAASAEVCLISEESRDTIPPYRCRVASKPSQSSSPKLGSHPCQTRVHQEGKRSARGRLWTKWRYAVPRRLQ